MRAQDQTPRSPATHDVVLIGGGHTHALLLKRWAMRPVLGARVTLINPGPSAPYTGMLPGHVAGHYPLTSLSIDLARLCRRIGARLVQDRAIGLDRAARRIQLETRPEIGYDLVSIDIGVTAEMPALPGFAEHAHPAKPMGAFAAAWERFAAAVAAGSAPPEIAVIGGGVAGVELALAMAHRLRAGGAAPDEFRASVLERGAAALPGLGPAAKARLMRALARYDVDYRTGAEIAAVAADHVALAGGARVPAAFTVGAAGAKAHPWLAETGLALTGGFIDVDATLRAQGDSGRADPSVFAVGDCAHLTHAPRPKAGVFAVRQTPVLDANLRAAVVGGRMRRYRPQKDYLKLVSLGEKRAAAVKHGFALEGRWLWRLKDAIDQLFILKLRAPPKRLAEGLDWRRLRRRGGAPDQPLCGGCGAKIGPAALAEALSAAPLPRRDDVLSLPGDDAAVLKWGAFARGMRQVITTDHLRAITPDPWLMGRIAAIHALGDVWAMGAAPQALLCSVVLPEDAPRLQARALREITAAVAAAAEEAGADLVGGHSSLGPELQIGVTATGVAEGAPIGLAGAQAGDALILTKPIGTGVILAAEMADAARRGALVAAYGALQRSLRPASAALSPAARAMTDVTGFGLAGHLIAMAEASGVGATLDLGAVPLLPGAEALAAAGVRSSLWLENARAAERLDAAAALRQTPRWDLLFDPQTCGGLLAAVPSDAAEALLAELASRGDRAAARIGEITEGPARIAVV